MLALPLTSSQNGRWLDSPGFLVQRASVGKGLHRETTFVLHQILGSDSHRVNSMEIQYLDCASWLLSLQKYSCSSEWNKETEKEGQKPRGQTGIHTYIHVHTPLFKNFEKESLEVNPILQLTSTQAQCGRDCHSWISLTSRTWCCTRTTIQWVHPWSLETDGCLWIKTIFLFFYKLLHLQ